MAQPRWYIPGTWSIDPFTPAVTPGNFLRVLREIPLAPGYSTYWTLDPVMKTKFATTRTFRTLFRPVEGSLRVFFGGEDYTELLENLTYDSSYAQFTLPEGDDNYLWVSYTLWHQTYSATNSLPSGYPESMPGVHLSLTSPGADSSSIVQIRQVVNVIEKELEMPVTRWVGGVSNMSIGNPDTLYNGITPVLAEHVRGIQRAISAIEEVIDRKKLTEGLFERTQFTAPSDSDTISFGHILQLIEAINRIYTVLPWLGG